MERVPLEAFAKFYTYKILTSLTKKKAIAKPLAGFAIALYLSSQTKIR